MLERWRRWNRSLLLRWPTVWKSRLPHMVLAYLFVGCPLLLAWGLLLPASRTQVVTVERWESLQLALFTMACLVLMAWAGLQLFRSPRRGQSGWGVLRLGLCYLLVGMIVLSSPVVFLFPSAWRQASVVPDGEFQKEYDFHGSYNFWCCDPRIDEDLVREHSQAIGTTLERYGLRQGGLRPNVSNRCGGRQRGSCLSMVSAATGKTIFLEDVMEGIWEAKQLRHLKGEYAAQLAGQFKMGFAVASVVALILLILGAANHPRQLRLPFSLLTGRRFKLPSPWLFLQRRYRWLRPWAAYHPAVWRHVGNRRLSRSWLWAAVLATLVVLVATATTDLPAEVRTSTWIGTFGITSSLVWLFLRGPAWPHRCGFRGALLWTLGVLVLMAILSGPLLWMVLELESIDEQLNPEIWVIIGIFVSMLVLMKYVAELHGRWMVGLYLLMAVAGWSLVGVFEPDEPDSWPLIWGVLGAPVILFRAHRSASLWRFLLAILFMSFFLLGAIGIVAWMGNDLESHYGTACAILLFLTIWLVHPIIQRYRTYPRVR